MIPWPTTNAVLHKVAAKVAAAARFLGPPSAARMPRAVWPVSSATLLGVGRLLVVADVLSPVVLRVVVRVLLQLDSVQDRTDEVGVAIGELLDRDAGGVPARHLGAHDEHHSRGGIGGYHRVRYCHDGRRVDDDPVEV